MSGFRHLIRFRTSPTLTVVAPGREGEAREKGKGKVERGMMARVLIKPYVKNLEEVCDLQFEDGMEALGVRYTSFQFVDEPSECGGD